MTVADLKRVAETESASGYPNHVLVPSQVLAALCEVVEAARACRDSYVFTSDGDCWQGDLLYEPLDVLDKVLDAP